MIVIESAVYAAPAARVPAYLLPSAIHAREVMRARPSCQLARGAARGVPNRADDAHLIDLGITRDYAPLAPSVHDPIASLERIHLAALLNDLKHSDVAHASRCADHAQAHAGSVRRHDRIAPLALGLLAPAVSSENAEQFGRHLSVDLRDATAALARHAAPVIHLRGGVEATVIAHGSSAQGAPVLAIATDVDGRRSPALQRGRVCDWVCLRRLHTGNNTYRASVCQAPARVPAQALPQ